MDELDEVAIRVDERADDAAPGLDALVADEADARGFEAGLLVVEAFEVEVDDGAGGFAGWPDHLGVVDDEEGAGWAEGEGVVAELRLGRELDDVAVERGDFGGW